MPDPSLIFEDPDDSPGTHVLIVAVGTYPYLLGGSHQNPGVAGGMGQLVAPPKSAESLAVWFLDKFQNPDRPLRSVALVVSAPAPFVLNHPKANGRPAPIGTIADVDQAIQAWAERCVNPESQAVFFFTGHGVTSAGDPLLLCRDFGQNPQRPFAGSLHTGEFLLAMDTRSPNYQLILIDSCQVPAEVAQRARGARLGSEGIGPAMAGQEARNGMPARQSVHLSTHRLAYGEQAATSLFTRALIQALDGGGSQTGMGNWVFTGSLQSALHAYVARLSKGFEVVQEPRQLKHANFQINRPLAVHAPLYVTSSPTQALRSAQIQVMDGQEVRASFDGPQQRVDEWCVVLPTRPHTVAAKFPQTTFRSFEAQTQIVTPETLLEIPC